MKKFLKIFFIVVVVLIAIYFIHSLITAKVYFDIYTAMKEKVESEEAFYGKLSSQTDETYKMEQEVFIKDNTFVKKITRTNTDNNEVVTLKFWQKYLPNKSENEDGTGYVFTDDGKQKGGSKFEYDKTALEPENKMYRYNSLRSMVLGISLQGTFFEHTPMENYTYSKILLSVLKHPTILYSTEFNGEKAYAIKQWYIFGEMGNFLFDVDEKPNIFDILPMLFESHTDYISKETKLPIGTDVGINGLPTTYEYFTKAVTDEDIKLPNVEEYTLQENN